MVRTRARRKDFSKIPWPGNTMHMAIDSREQGVGKWTQFIEGHAACQLEREFAASAGSRK